MSETVAVIICTHLEQRFDQLKLAVASLERQTRQPDEVVIVVDGTPALAERVRTAMPCQRLVELPEPSGLAAARNAGVAVCSAEIVLFLDDDAVAHEEWVESLTDAMRQSRVLGASGYSAPRWGAKRPVWLPEEFLWTLGCSYAGLPSTRTEVRNVYGGCCGLRRSLFTELGGFDHRLGRSRMSKGGGEEAELCLRAKRRWPTACFAYEPAARIDHFVWPERLKLSYVLRRSYDEGKMKATVAALEPGGLAPELRFAAKLPIAFVHYISRGIKSERDGLARAAALAAFSSSVIAGLIAGRVGHVLESRFGTGDSR